MRFTAERAGIEPLRLETRGGRHRHVQDLIVGDLAGVAVLEGEVLEEVHVEAGFDFAREGWPQIRVAERDLDRATTLNGELLVLRIEHRAETRLAVRHAELEFVDAGQREIFRHAVGARQTLEELRALIGAEQRGLVATNETVDDELVLDVERGDREEVLVADRLRVRTRDDRALGIARGGRELGHARHRERRCEDARAGVVLVFVHPRQLGGVRKPGRGLGGRQRAAEVVGFRLIDVARDVALADRARGADVAERHVPAQFTRATIEVRVGFVGEPLEGAVAHLERARKAVAVVQALDVGPVVERVADVARGRRLTNGGLVRRAVRVVLEQVDVRLEEAETEERVARAVVGRIGLRLAVEGARLQVELGVQLEIEVHAEILAVVPA